nr:hypothetical protein TDPV-338 [Oriental turtle dovepox virus]
MFLCIKLLLLVIIYYHQFCPCFYIVSYFYYYFIKWATTKHNVGYIKMIFCLLFSYVINT